ncbi:RNA polymerase sigma factor, sigma-70 family [Lentzea xinjiangensis]|uniref:RNA polymerase sigma factor, sigma-70 family n=1 Tax=Lentzea xinjiangensis TaxID=402600 RepID=A0A1H9AYR3_9PSEU|nr:sigma-70 family RNA polymerase sigma factor [Lentzea xinjiangensis]SEP81583.1 RNA polymerase sigma factor, sigma-70 family [Lentzea xinjiangensis]
MDSNTEVLVGWRSGSHGWDALVERYSRLVWSVPRSFRLSHADAADVYQCTWLCLAEHLTRIRRPEGLGLWLVRTATRQSIAVVRARGREVPLDLWEPESPLPAPDEVAVTTDRQRRLWTALTTLNERCQRLLRIAAHSPELSYAQVAETLGIKVGTVGPTRSRCLAELRRKVEGLR